MLDLKLEVSHCVLINAEKEKVWKVLTDPELIKEYLYGTETITDWRPGSEIIFQGEYEGHKYRDHGRIVTYLKNEEISYSYWSGFSGLEDKSENYSMVIYKLKAVQNKTEFTWIQKGFADSEKQKHSGEGLPALLEQIKLIAERIQQ